MNNNRASGTEIPERRNAYGSNGNVRLFSHSNQLFRAHIPTEFILLCLIETIVLTISFCLGVQLRVGELHMIDLQGSVVFGIVMMFSLIAMGAYKRESHKTTSLLTVRVASSLLLGFVLLSLTYYLFPALRLEGTALTLIVMVGFVNLMATRLVFMRLMKAYDMRLRVLVLGAGKTSNIVRDSMQKGELDGLNIITFMPMPCDVEKNKGISPAKKRGAITKFVAEKNIDVIVMAMDDRRNSLPVQDLLDCKMGGVSVIDLLTFFERYTNKIRLDIMQPSWMFLSDGFTVSSFRRIWKRLMDILFALVLVPLVFPFFILAVILIQAESMGRGAVFYSQTRVGEGGRLFQIYKFRTMVNDAEGDGVARWAEKNDMRITRVGSFLRKYRLDEIPQLYNILRGNMSFVGPRPERPEFVEQLIRTIPYYNERHRVKPGLTGWAQINYNYGASIEDGLEKLQYDLFYIKNYNIFLDSLVFLQTAHVVLLGRGAR